MAKNQTATPGSHIAGPLYVEASDPAQTDFTDLPSAVDDQSGGSADTTDYTFVAVSGSGADATINNNLATIAALLDAILERIQ